MRYLMAVLLVSLTELASLSCAAQPPNNIIAQYASPIVDIYGSINYDDGNKVVYVATADGNVHEIFYKNSGYGSVPADHGDSVVGHFDSSIVAIAGFYAEDDHNRIVEVATADGNIHELFYNPTNGRGESVIYNQPGVVGLAAFYNRDDHFRDVLVAAADGTVRELYYYPQMHADMLRTYSGIVDVAGYYDRSNDNRVSTVLTSDNILHILAFHHGQQDVTYNLVPGAGVRVTSLAANAKRTAYSASNGWIHVADSIHQNYGAFWSSHDDLAPGIVKVGIGEDDDSDVVYATNDSAIHVFVPAPAVPPLPPPTITMFTALPNDGYVNVGTPVQLSWKVDQCNAPCTVSLVGRDGFNYAHTQTQKTGLANPSGLTVTTTDTQTQFTLSASGSNGAAKPASLVVTLAPNSNNCASCMWFYFVLTNPNSASRPCFTQAEWAISESAAEAAASDPGYAIMTTDYNGFINGCS